MSDKKLQEIGILALKESYAVHESLGVEGEQEITKNQHGETALKVDIECEKAIINLLKNKSISIKIISEEHGTTIIGSNPKYTGILDGLDGSNIYRKARSKGRYGTMFAIFSGLNPLYSDYIFSGAIEHAANNLYYATKDNGSSMISKDKKIPISCNSKSKIDKRGIIYIDEYFNINKKAFSEKLRDYNTIYSDSSCIYYVDVASGKADFALECTRKGNLEIAIAYGLIRESGGTMITLDAENLGNKKYLDFGQVEKIPIITASNLNMAKNLLKHLSHN